MLPLIKHKVHLKDCVFNNVNNFLAQFAGVIHEFEEFLNDIL